MTIKSIFVGIFSLFAVVVTTSPLKAQSNDMSLDELYAWPNMIGTTPRNPAWSADGQKIAFLWNDEGYHFRDVWVYDTATGEKSRLTNLDPNHQQSELHQGVGGVEWLSATSLVYSLNGSLTRVSLDGASSAFLPEQKVARALETSPDGQKLAFVSDGDLWVFDIASGEAQSLVVYDNPKQYILNFLWSYDSSHIAFQMTDDSPKVVRDVIYQKGDERVVEPVSRAYPGEDTSDFAVGMVTMGGDVTMFERPDMRHHIWGYGISSDNKRLFINSSDMQIKYHSIYMYDTATGQRETFYQEHDPKHTRPDWRAAWAPNDDGLIILTDRDGYLHLYHQKTAGGELRQITNGTWEIFSFDVDRANGTAYFIANKSALEEQLLYRVPLAGGEVEMVSPATSGTHVVSFNDDFSRVASIYSNDTTPIELYDLDLAINSFTQVTQSPRDNFYDQPWTPVVYERFKSRLDGIELNARITLPKDFKEGQRYPLIVGSVYSDSVRNQYGGRIYHPTGRFDQYMAHKGYIVMNVNIRGSWGQGREHTNSQLHGYGVKDIEDLHSGVEHLINKGWVDADRVGIWGSSYGGLMTMHSLFKKPGVYAAGVAGAPATNVRHAYPAQMWIMGPHDGDDQPERYNAQSAKFHTDGLEDALMIIHGTRDSVVMYSDTIDVAERLMKAEKDFELVTLPGVGHGWDAEHADVRRFAFEKMVKFFDEHLKK